MADFDPGLVELVLFVGAEGVGGVVGDDVVVILPEDDMHGGKLDAGVDECQVLFDLFGQGVEDGLSGGVIVGDGDQVGFVMSCCAVQVAGDVDRFEGGDLSGAVVDAAEQRACQDVGASCRFFGKEDDGGVVVVFIVAQALGDDVETAVYFNIAV